MAINTKRGCSKYVGPNIAQNRHRQTVRQQTPFFIFGLKFSNLKFKYFENKIKEMKTYYGITQNLNTTQEQLCANTA